jgi:hypothetical protein
VSAELNNLFFSEKKAWNTLGRQGGARPPGTLFAIHLLPSALRLPASGFFNHGRILADVPAFL